MTDITRESAHDTRYAAAGSGFSPNCGVSRAIALGSDMPQRHNYRRCWQCIEAGVASCIPMRHGRRFRRCGGDDFSIEYAAIDYD